MPLSFRELLDKYLTDSLSKEEAALFDQLAHEPASQAEMKEVIDELLDNNSWGKDQQVFLKELNFQMIRQRIAEKQRNGHPIISSLALRRWWWAAASIILVVGAAVFFIVSFDRSAQNSTNSLMHTAEILPGKNGAILTLADGSQVLLDSIQNGVVALQGGATAKVVNGSLQYEGSGNEAVYNTMSTPKGRQFQVTLPDGTKVWLNAASSIRYPTVFNGKERKVEIRGEAYFEVAKNTEMPFRVNVNDRAEIKVLGTYFNVNAYENEENMNTTLIQGSVKVYAGQMDILASQETLPGMEAVLKPGQQAQMLNDLNGLSGTHTANNIIKVINNADIDRAMAWKNGLFHFTGLSFQEVMRQLERWYDISVVYENDKVPNKQLIGEMTRGVSLHDVLEHLENIGIRHKLADRTLFILP